MTGRRGWPFLLLLAACGSSPPAVTAPGAEPRADEPRTEPAARSGRHIVDPPSPERTTLGNGLRVISLRDAVSPIVHVELAVHAGSVFEPQGKHGLSDLSAAVVRAGGTATIPSEALEVRLQELETTLEVDVGPELAVFRATCPPARAREALELISYLVADPRHAKETVRREMVELERRWQARLVTDPGGVFVDRWLRNEGSQIQRIDQLRDLSLTDVVNFHALYYRPARACVGIAGPMEPKQAAAVVEKAFARWTSEGPGPSPRPARPFASSVTWLPAQSNRADVAIFLPGTRPDGRNAITHEVLIECLTREGLGGRISRQFAKAGLPEQAVAVSYREGSDGGCWVVRMRAPVDGTAGALQALREALASLAADQPRRDEVAVAVSRVRARMLRACATPGRQVALQARAEVLGSPPGFIAASLRRLDELTAADLRTVMQERRELDAAFALMGGPRPEKEAFLVQMRPEEPPVKAATGSAPAPGAEEKARRVLALAVQKLGGEKALRELRALAWESVARGRDDLPIEESTVAMLPDRIRRVEKVLKTKIVTVVAGDHGASSSPRKVVQLAPDECASMTAALLRNPALLLAHVLTREPRPPVRLLKRESVEDRWLAVLELQSVGNLAVRVAIDEESGLVRRVSGAEWRPMRGLVPVEEEFEDYRPVGDLQLPHRSLLWMEGEFHSETVFRMIKPIAAPGDETFVVPSSPGR